MVVGNEEVKARIVCRSVAYMVITTGCGKVILQWVRARFSTSVGVSASSHSELVCHPLDCFRHVFFCGLALLVSRFLLQGLLGTW